MAYKKLSKIAAEFSAGTIAATALANASANFQKLLDLLKLSYEINLKLGENPEDVKSIEEMGRVVGRAAIIILNKKPILMQLHAAGVVNDFELEQLLSNEVEPAHQLQMLERLDYQMEELRQINPEQVELWQIAKAPI